MTNREAINIITAKMDVHQAVFGHPVDEPLKTAYETAISALEKQSRVITVTDVEGVMLASISNKDIVWTDRVRVIVSEEQDG